VDGLGLADQAPAASADPALRPRLTCEMVTRLQGWRDEWGWRFSGLKTARYRQIGNAFPPPVAEAVGRAIRRALEHADAPEVGTEIGTELDQGTNTEPAGSRDPVFGVLRGRDDFLTAGQIADLAGLSPAAVLEHLRHLGQDFELETAPEMSLEMGPEMGPQMGTERDGPAYRLGPFRAFLGQRDHARHQRFAAGRATIS